MKIGPLRHRVTFQKRSKSLNNYRESQDSWEDIAETWASIEPLTGREFFTALQTQSDVNVRIICRYSRVISGVKAQDRILYGSTKYDIRHPPIDKDMKHHELHFMCTVHAE